MLPNTQFPADLVTFTEETLNEKLQFFCAVVVIDHIQYINLMFVTKLRS